MEEQSNHLKQNDPKQNTDNGNISNFKEMQEQEESSISSNEYGASNEVGF